MADEYLTAEDVAKILGVSVKTLHSWRYKKRGPKSFKLGSKGSGAKLRYDRADLEAWINEQKAASA